MPEEEWRPVAAERYGEAYEVSNQGRVRRTLGNSYTQAGRVLKNRTNKSGHKRVALQHHEAGLSYKNFMVHRLVLEAFVGPCPLGMEACHNDCDPANNALENLRWDTRSANHYDRENRGARIRGESNGRAKLSEAEVRKIRDDCRSSTALAAEYRVAPSTIRRVLAKKIWSNVA